MKFWSKAWFTDRWVWLVGGVVVAVAIVAGLAAPLVRVGAQPAGPSTPTATVQRGALIQTAAASGVINSNTYLYVNFKQAGRLAALHVKVGDLVRPGQLLATQESRDLEAAVAQARAKLEQAQVALTDALDGPTPQARAVAEAERDAALRAADYARESAELARARADRDIEFARSSLAIAQQTLDGAIAMLDDSVLPSSQRDMEFAESNLRQAERSLADTIRVHHERTLPGNVQDIAVAAAAVETAHTRLAIAQQTLADSTVPATEQDLAAAQQTLANARQSLIDAERNLVESTLPQNQQDIQLAQQRLQIAQQQAVDAQARLVAAQARAEADIESAQNSLDAARRNQADAVAQLALTLQRNDEAIKASEASTRQAEANLDRLLATKPTLAQLAQAKAAIAAAEERLSNLLENRRTTVGATGSPDLSSDDSVYAKGQADIESARSQLEAARANYEDLLDTPKAADIAVAQGSIDSAKASLASERASAELGAQNGRRAVNQADGAVEAAEQSLELARLRARQTTLDAQAAIDAAQGDVQAALDGVEAAAVRGAGNEQRARTQINQATNAVRAAEASLAQVEARRQSSLVRGDAAIVEAKSALELARRNLEQARARAETNRVNGEAAIDSASGQRDAAEAALEQARARAAAADESARAQVSAARAQVDQSAAALNRAIAQARTTIQSERADADAANAKATAAIAEFERQVAPPRPEDVAALQADVKVAEADLAKATAGLEYARLRAPAAGTIGSINNAGIGQFTPGSGADGSSSTNLPFIVLADLSDLAVKASIAEADIANLEIGDEATFTCDPFPNDTFNAKLLSLAASGANAQGIISYDATFALTPTRARLLPGMTANLTITIDRRDNVLLAPNRAIQAVGEARRVSVWRNGRVVDVDIEIGLSNDGFSEVVAGDLREGDTVLLTGVSGRRF